MQFIWLTIGAVAFVLGGIGIPLPGWPTTIFWIIAAYCFANSHPKWRDWIYARPGIGPVIENFNENGVLSKSSKLGALAGMVFGGAVATLFLWTKLPWLALTWLLIIIGAMVVLSRPTA